MGKYKVVLFDFDGTLMDTSEGIYESAFYSLDKLKVKISDTVNLVEFIGPSLSYGFSHVFNIKDSVLVSNLITVFREHYHKIGAFKAKFYSGFPDILNTLYQMKFILGISSMKNTDLINVMLKYFKFNQYFSGVFGLNLKSTNTKADVIKDAIDYFSVKPSECVLVGDSKYDYEGAEIAGVDCIKVNWGFGFKASDFDTVSNTEELLQKIINA